MLPPPAAKILPSLLLAALASGATGCGERAMATPAAPRAAAAAPVAGEVAVRLATPEPALFRGTGTATGDLRPEQSASLSFSVPGTLQRVEVKRGQLVRKGDLLASLDASLARATLAQADAGLAAASAQERQAEDGLARAKSMKAAEGVSEAQMIQAQVGRELAAAQVLAARAQRDQAEVNLRWHSLRAPFDGVVTRVPEGAGIALAPGMPAFAVEGTLTLVLETSVTAADARSIKIGSKANVASAAGGGESDDGSVRAVVASADPRTHRIPVEIAVPNADGRFFAHSFARARLGALSERAALRVPAGALVQRDGAFSIFVAEAGVARLVRVEVLGQEADDALIEPAAPLPAGAGVVDMPPHDLADGARLHAIGGGK